MNTSRQTKHNSWIQRVDWIIILFLIVFALISVTIISSAMGGGQYSANFSIRQILYYIFGFIIALFIMFISPKKLMKYTYLMYRNTHHTNHQWCEELVCAWSCQHPTF